MRRFATSLLTVTLLTAGRGVAEEKPAPLPPVNGEVAGQLVVPRIPGLPALAWRVQMKPAAGADLAFDATAKAEGLDLQIEFTLPRGEAPGMWRIVRAKLEAAAWWHLSVEMAGVKALPPDFEFGGQMTIEGAGQWRGAEASGTLHVKLEAGTAGSEAQKWRVAGLTLDADLVVAASRVTVRSAHLSADTVQAASVTARNFLVEITGAPGGQLSVTRAEVSALGGRIALAPFVFDPIAPAVKTVAEFSSVNLSEIAALVPHAVKEAKGQLAGRVTVSWSLKSGLGPTQGSLSISAGEAATLSLVESPGLLTTHAPERLEFLPTYTGKLRQWFSAANPAYDMLRRIELGQAPLAVESFDVSLYPDGEDAPRTGQVNVVARPVGRSDAISRVTFTVNLSGPLDQVMKLGLENKAKLQLNPTK